MRWLAARVASRDLCREVTSAASASAGWACSQDALNFAPSPLGTSSNGLHINAVNGAPAPNLFYNGTFASQFHTCAPPDPSPSHAPEIAAGLH